MGRNEQKMKCDIPLLSSASPFSVWGNMFFTHRQSVKRFSSSFGLQTERIKGPKSNIDLKRGQKDKNLAPFPSGRKNPEEHLRFDIAMTMIRCPNLQELYPTRRPNLHGDCQLSINDAMVLFHLLS